MIPEGLFEVIKTFLDGVNVFFVIYMIAYSTFLFLAVVVGSSTLYRTKQQVMLKNVLEKKYYIPVSIIVPAYNEEMTVVETVRSLLELDYTVYEIIVVDDGSKDTTSQVLIDAFNMQRIRQPIRRRINCQQEEFVYTAFGQKVSLTLIR